MTLPVLEFLFASQSTHNIVSPLLMFFTALRKISVFSKPKRVEVDFAWALIHSLLLTINSTAINQYNIEPRHEISNNVVCATSKGSDQPAHTRSLIRAFASLLNIL